MSQTTGNNAPDRLRHCECKLGTVIDKYSIEQLDDKIVQGWVGETEERMSLRELAKYFNKQVLRAAMQDSACQFVDDGVETIYALLTDDDASMQVRQRVRTQLEDGGIDPDRVIEDFVSYQTVNRHLKQCHDVKRDAEPETDGQYVRRRIQKVYALENKLDAVMNDILEQLDSTGRISLSDFETTIKMEIQCSNCGAHHNITDIVENRGCLCKTPDRE
ncbi:rod-determining factor RdfA [Halomontanus rarus]|uniref:rod-determining factor RdfA n=1 Tax=Halomontanus rarus TaxID=3034020 RepID=UPI0023E86E60|nr:rod-determining factor RdfA [Halovivax sp. TS33]